MPDDALAQVLQLVADGRLSAEEAAPILDALEGRSRADATAQAGGAGPGGFPGPGPGRPVGPSGQAESRERGGPRFAHIEVTEGGRKAVNLRIPLSLGRRALSAIPGLSWEHAAQLDEAVNRGHSGPLLDIADEDGDGVRIVLE